MFASAALNGPVSISLASIEMKCEATTARRYEKIICFWTDRASYISNLSAPLVFISYLLLLLHGFREPYSLSVPLDDNR